ncbi:MAG: L,D-transpeptidase family protein [Planctomycetota bacterium]
MARYYSGMYGRRRGRKRRRAYVISALMVVGAAIASVCGYNPAHKSERVSPASPAAFAGTYVEEVVDLAPREPAPVIEVEPKVDLPEYPQEAGPDANPEVDKLIAEGMVLVASDPGRITEVRDKLSGALPMPMTARQMAAVKGKLSDLADRWLFTRTVYEADQLCSNYEVKPGDQLRKIGSQFKVPYEILMRINNINRANTLRAGEMIKVINGPFHARIYKSTFTMDLYLQDTFVRSFRVALGRPGMETPTGHWVVKPNGKLISPTWTDPVTGKTYQAEDPDYPLGSRWIGLEGIEGAAKGRTGFAIHGTKDPADLGAAQSRGCIRLYDEDVKLVYELLVPGLSQVVVE